MSKREREVDAAPRMSDHEALMWNVEKDPWLNPNGASITILDKPVDMDVFRRYLRHGITKMPRLYQRVVPGLGRLSTPAWAPDPEFDFDYHVREVELPGAGTDRQLLDLAARLYSEPMDRTRPLWRFVIIGGVEGGRGAIWAQVHHAIADGIGQLRMAELYQQIAPDQPPPDEVDLEGVIAAAIAEHGAKESGGDLATSLISTTKRTVGHVARRQAGISRRLMGEVMLWPADIGRVSDRVDKVAAAAQSIGGLLAKSGQESSGGSPLWAERSRHRHLEYVRVSLDDLKRAAKQHGGSINDAFMAGLSEAAVRYHRDHNVVVDRFNTSFVVSTRTDSKIGGNSFTPVLVQVSGREMGFAERMADLQKTTAEARSESDRSGGVSGLSGVINLLPTSVVTRTARKQAAHIDFATSNLRGAPFTLYCAGAEVVATICMGPVAGTALNVTALSYDGQFDIGLFMDPRAISDPEHYRACVESAFADLIASAEPPKPATASTAKTRTPRKSAAKKTATKKATAKKTATKKATARKATARKATAKKGAAKKATAKKGAAKKAPAKKAGSTGANATGTAVTKQAPAATTASADAEAARRALTAAANAGGVDGPASANGNHNGNGE